jgi:hypothetical protein
MAILGSSIDPRLQLQDYSGFVNAAQMQAQGLAGLGQQISQASEQYKQYKTEQKEALKRVKEAEVFGNAITTLLPETKGSIGAAIEKLRDPNIPLYERDGIAKSIREVADISIAQERNRALMGLQREQLGLERDRFAEAKRQYTDEQLIREADLQFKQNQAQVDEEVKQQNDAMKAAALLAGFQGRMESVGKKIPDEVANSISTLASQGKGTAALQIAEGYGQSVPDIAKVNTFESTFLDPITRQPINATIVNKNGKFVVPEIDIEIPPADDYQLPSRQPGEFQSGPGVPPDREPQGATGLMLPQELQEQGIQNAIEQASPRTMRVPLAAPARQAPLVSVSSAPTPPAGYQNIFDAQGNLVRQEIIPGSPADTAQKTEAESKIGNAESYLAALGDFSAGLATIPQGTGLIGTNVRAVSQRMLGTEMSKLQATKSKLDANAFVDAVTRLRANSPTGATGLGSVTEKEGQRLVDLAGNIDPVNIETAKQNTDRLLFEIANQAYGTKEFRDKQLKNKEITKEQYDDIMNKRSIALRGEFGKVLDLRIQAEREAGSTPRPSAFGGTSPDVQRIIDENQ